jgi:WS/DGAT/MGAT family acyltransferase
MQRIPGKDAIFLWSETPTTHMTIGFAGVFDPSTIPGGVEGPGDVYDRFVRLLEDRLHLVPKFRQRVMNVPFGIGNPYFVEDPTFDLGYHVRRIAMPEPGDKRLLEEFVARMMSRPLDMTKPLWEVYVVEGVEGDKWAYVAKAHHVLVDGVGGNEMLVQLLDLEPTPREVEAPAEAWDPDPLPSDLDLLRTAVGGGVRKPLHLVDTVRRTAGVAIDFAKWGIGRADDDPGLKVLGPRTFLNGPIGPHRQVALGKFSLDDVKYVKGTFGCTVNDVILAITGRGLRHFVEAHGQTTNKGMIAAVPISIRDKGDKGFENKVSGMTVPMHDDVEDVAERLRRISLATKPAKEQLGAVAAHLLQDWSEYAPPAVAAQAIRFYTRAGLARRHPPIANVTLSNVPGPPFPLYLAGSQMKSMYPIGPVIHNQRVNITVVSYMDTMFLGIAADRDDVPPIGELVDHIVDGLKELHQAAQDAGGPKPKDSDADANA